MMLLLLLLLLISINYYHLYIIQRLFKQENYGTIEIKGSTIIDFYSKYPEPIFYVNNLNYLDNGSK